MAKQEESSTSGIIIVIGLIILILLIIAYVYYRNTNNFINYNSLTLFRIQHVKSRKYITMRQVVKDFLLAAPPDTSDRNTNPYTPVLTLTEDPNDALGVWAIIQSSETPKGQRWTLQNNFTKKYLTGFNASFGIPGAYSYTCNNNEPPSQSRIGKGHIYLTPADGATIANSGSSTGSNRSATIPSRFTISVESELGDLLPIYTNPPVKGNPNFGTDVLVAFNEKSKHQGDVFALRVPVIGI
ncbi:MAG: hypothetical protein GY751_13900 [Bacteroidetes bacterium]|nr:hypothetical protein [Bacteroidota bacterium]